MSQARPQRHKIICNVMLEMCWFAQLLFLRASSCGCSSARTRGKHTGAESSATADFHASISCRSVKSHVSCYRSGIEAHERSIGSHHSADATHTRGPASRIHTTLSKRKRRSYDFRNCCGCKTVADRLDSVILCGADPRGGARVQQLQNL